MASGSADGYSGSGRRSEDSQLQRNAGGRLFHTAAELNAFITQLNAAGGFGGRASAAGHPDNARFSDSFSSFDVRVSKVFKLGERREDRTACGRFNLFNVTNVLGFSKSNYSGFQMCLCVTTTIQATPASCARRVLVSLSPQPAECLVLVAHAHFNLRPELRFKPSVK